MNLPDISISLTLLQVTTIMDNISKNDDDIEVGYELEIRK